MTILGGDVHLAACGRFYSNPKLQIPVERDHRFMANVVSSAITNHPPPEAVANLLARRNKIHRFDGRTDETLMKLFDRDPCGRGNRTGAVKTGGYNQVTMPSRNYAVLTETEGVGGGDANGGDNHGYINGAGNGREEETAKGRRTDKNAGHAPLHAGEEGAGTTHPAADGLGGAGQGRKGDLAVCFRVEIDQHDAEGRTEGYGFSSESFFLWVGRVNDADLEGVVPVLVGKRGEGAG